LNYLFYEYCVNAFLFVWFLDSLLGFSIALRFLEGKKDLDGKSPSVVILLSTFAFSTESFMVTFPFADRMRPVLR